VCFAALILVFPEASLAGASSALQNWMLNVLPSLLPFFMAASLLRTSGAAAKLARIMSPLTRRLGYPPAFAYAFTVSLLTGSPSGAAAVCASYREEGFSESHARRMLNAAFNASPLFMTGFVSVSILENPALAHYILIPHYTAAFFILIINARFGKKNAADTYAPAAPPLPHTVGEQLNTAVSYSIENILTILGFMMLYSVLISVLRSIGLPEKISMCVSGILEMTTGISDSTALPLKLRIIFINAVLGFGGLSVHSQVYAIASRNGIRPRGFALSRILHGAAAAAISALMLLT